MKRSNKRMMLVGCVLLASFGAGGVAAAGPRKKKPAVPAAPPLPAGLPAVGEPLTPWPMKTWLDGDPLPTEAAGKVIVHWFCGPKIKTCAEDLERVVRLREDTHVYVIAYINGTARDARKLDPIKGGESSEPGAVAYGKDVATHLTRMALGKGPSSIVVGVDGKVALVTVDGDAAALEARDAKVSELVKLIKDYTSTADGPARGKVGTPFTLTLTINLAPWLDISTTAPTEFSLAAPREWTCDAKELRGSQLERSGKSLRAKVTCTSSASGTFESRGEIRFGYTSLSGGSGIGADGFTWKFDIAK